ncbi:MAG TPA: hypothetical protein VIM74_10580 [Casimicrobiaceae bacterium]|jgi:hypothetical protein
MALIFRNFSVYVNGAKVGTMEGADYGRKSGNELQIGDGAVLGVSIGVGTVDLKINTVVPYQGSPVLQVLETAYKNGTQVQVNIGILNGEDHMVDLWVMECTTTTQTKNGECKGTYNLIGGEGEQV